MTYRRMAVVAMAIVAATPGTAIAQGAPEAERTGDIIVRFKASADAQDRSAARGAADVRWVRGLELDGAQLVEPEPGVNVDAAIARLEAESDVRYAEPDRIWEVDSTTPDDPRFADGQLWGLHNTELSRPFFGGIEDADIDAPEAWDVTTGSSDVVVAVVDTGILTTHPDLADRMWRNPGEVPGNGVDDDGNGKIDDVHGWNFVDDDAKVTDVDGHGTHVAGTIGATGDNGMGLAGVGWNTTLMALKGCAWGGCPVSATSAAFTYAGQEGADVVNGSFGGFGTPSPFVTDIVRAQPDTLFVFSAGNNTSDNDARPKSPCMIDAPNVLCVAATTSGDQKAGFSNFGATSVDLGAPGMEIVSAGIDSRQTLFSDLMNGETIGPLWTTTGEWKVVNASPGNNFVETKEDGATLATADSYDLAGKTGCVLHHNYSIPYETFSWDDGIFFDWKVGDADWVDSGRYIPVGGGWGRTTRSGFPHADDIRFRLRAKTAKGSATVRIDEPALVCDGVLTGDTVSTLSGTSMASPHVAGAAGLLLAAKPGATVAELKTALLDHGDPNADLAGRTVTGKRLNVNNSVRAIIRNPTVDAPVFAGPVSEGRWVLISSRFSDPEGAGPPDCTIDPGDGTGPITGVVFAGRCSVAHVYLDDKTYRVETTITMPDGRFSGASTRQAVEVAAATERKMAGKGKLAAPEGKPKFEVDLASSGGTLTAELPEGDLAATANEWLAADVGRTARAKGTARLGERSGLRFVAIAVGRDDDSQGRLRLKVWDPATGAVVYDNQPGAPISAVPPEVPSGKVQVG